MGKLYVYVVDRDFGFAPNPFHGTCTLATCKPGIRSTAQVGDWVVGVGGGRLKATGKCVFAMQVSEKISFDDYYNDPRFKDKKPVRNGSKKMMLGDNIYHYDEQIANYHQAHSHHSNPDGSINEHNRTRDTGCSRVLISRNFFYFGSAAPEIPTQILSDMSYVNQIGHRVFHFPIGKSLVDWLEADFSEQRNIVVADPFNFDKSEAHYSVLDNKISKI